MNSRSHWSLSLQYDVNRVSVFIMLWGDVYKGCVHLWCLRDNEDDVWLVFLHHSRDFPSRQITGLEKHQNYNDWQTGRWKESVCLFWLQVEGGEVTHARWAQCLHVMCFYLTGAAEELGQSKYSFYTHAHTDWWPEVVMSLLPWCHWPQISPWSSPGHLRLVKGVHDFPLDVHIKWRTLISVFVG